MKPYKEYLKLVHFFLELFENEGIPKKPQTALPMPETSLPESFRLEAFNQAIKDMEQEPYLSVEARKKLKKMTCEREPGRYGFRQYKSDASFSWELSKIRSVLKFGSRRWALG